MQHEAIEILISEQRINTYYKVFKGDKQKAFEYYQLNIQIAQSLYPMLLYTEVSLRNLIHRSCMLHFKDVYWFRLCNQQEQVLKINSAIRKTSKNWHVVAPDKIIAELTFGFWCSLFNKDNAKHFWKPLKYAFPYLERSINREKLSLKLNHIRRLRNRISHYEPICNDLKILWQNYLNITYVLKSMHPQLVEWTYSFIDFELLYQKAQLMRTKNPITDVSYPK